MLVRVTRDDVAISKFRKYLEKGHCTAEFVRTVEEKIDEYSYNVFDFYNVTPPKLDDEHSNYKVLKRFDHTERIVKTVLNEDTENNNQYLEKCKCDDCNKNIRSRRFSYLLENLETHKKIQVGSACLKKYIPIQEKAVFDSYWKIDEMNEFSCGCLTSYMKYTDCLPICVDLFLNDYHGDYDAYKYGVSMSDLSYSRWMDSVSGERYAKANEIAEKLVKYINECEENNEYIRNVKAILKNGYFSKTNFNLFRSIVSMIKYLDRKTYEKSLESGKHDVKVKKFIKSVEDYNCRGFYWKNHFITDNDEYVVMTSFDDIIVSEGRNFKIDVKKSSEFNGTVYNFAFLSR